MRLLRHPLATFMLSVLVVIGLGVAVVAATTDQEAYATSWARFTAAFPGRVYVAHQRPSTSPLNGLGAALPVSANTVTYSNEPAFALKSTNGVLFVEVTTGITADLENNLAMRLKVAAYGEDVFQPGVTVAEEVANGLTVITFGPQCASGLCSAMRIVFSNRALWTLGATSTAPPSTVESFLDSFEPIG